MGTGIFFARGKDACPLFLFALFAAPIAHAAGFALDVHGARPTGMGAAFTALADDASSVYFNPAGLTGRRGLQLQLGDTVLLPSVEFTPAGGQATATELRLSTPPHLFARYGVHERVAVGLGAYSAFGSSSRWPDGWVGRFRSTSSQLATYALQPTVAVKLHDAVSAAFGVHLLRGTVLLERDLDFLGAQGHAMLGGGGWGFGFDLGLKVHVVPERLSFGAVWHGPSRLDFGGRVHFSDVPPEFQAVLADQAITSSVRLPHVLQAGLGFRATPRLRAALEGRFTGWSSFPSLDFHYEDPSLDSSTPKRWRDVVSVHLGAEYDVAPALRARAGLVWDPTPSPEDTLTPDLPDADRFKVAVGVGTAFGAFSVDAAYQFVLLASATSTAPGFEGTYSGAAHVVGLTLGFSARE